MSVTDEDDESGETAANDPVAGLGTRLRAAIGGTVGAAALLLVVYAATLAFIVLLQPAGVADSFAARYLADVPPALVVLLLAIAGSRWFGLELERQRAWRFLALASASFVAAQLADFIIVVSGGAPFPSPADAIALLFFPAAAVSLVWFIRTSRDEPVGARFWLDAATVAVSFGAFLWFFAVAPIRALAIEHPLEGVTALVYTTGNSAIVIMAGVLLLRQSDWRRRPDLVWISAGMFALLSGDLLWLKDQLSPAPAALGLPDFLHVLAFALFAQALAAERRALDRGETEPAIATRTSGLVSIVPFAGLTLAVAVLVYFQLEAWAKPSGVMTLVVCGTVLLVLARQAVATGEIADLRARLALEAAEARFSSLVRNSADVIAVVETSGTFRFVTPSAERVFGIAPATMLGRHLADFVSLEDRGRTREFFNRAIELAGATDTLEVRVTREDARVRVLEVVGTNLSDDPAVNGCVLNLRDITDRKGLEEQLKRLAFHDPLTLLANRALFRDRVEHAVAVSRRSKRPVAVMFVDLDNFKKINDSLGHGVGDRVLRASAQRISKCTRAADTVARLGGDEFAVLVEDGGDERAVLEIASRIVEALQQPFAFSGSDMRVAASVGVAFLDPEEGVEELLRNADVAMYHAKAQGKGRYAVFQPQMQAAVRERLRVETDLSRAIRMNEFQLHYQPIVDLKSGYLIGVEALVRWQHPERGLISPAEFIGVAEDTGQVIGLGRWVLRQACREVRLWQEKVARGKQLRVAVNVSGRQLQASDLISDVTRALEESGLEPGCLVIEMTESVVMQNTEATLAKLQRLKRLGVRLAIDDFGTGYSSLSYLHRFPIDILKIDRSFVQRLGEDRDGAELARAIITLGDALGLEVVAEGIEYEHQQRELLELGCVAGQGYYYLKPAPLKEIEYSVHVKRREMLANNLPDQVDITATGRFRRPTGRMFAAVGDPLGNRSGDSGSFKLAP